MMKSTGKSAPRISLTGSRFRFFASQEVVVSIILFAAYFSLGLLKHGLLNTHVFDLGLYEQWAFLAGAGRWNEVGSFYQGFTRSQNLLFGDHFSLMLFPIGILYRLWSSSALLIFLQSLSVAASYFLFFTLPFPHVDPLMKRAAKLIFLLSPIIFNTALDLFSFEPLAMPFLVLSLWLARTDKSNFLSLACCFIALSAKDYCAIWVLGLGIYLISLKKYSIGSIISLSSLAWFLFALWINSGNNDKISERLGWLPELLSGESIFRFLHSERIITSAAEDLPFNYESFGGSIEYLIVVLLPLLIFLSYKSIPALIGALPILSVNLLASTETMRSLIYHYQLPILFWVVVGFLDSCYSGTVISRLLGNQRTALRLFVCFLSFYFFLLSESSQVLTAWWNKSALASDVFRSRVVLNSLVDRGVGGGVSNDGCRLYTTGDIATRFSGFDGICWTPFQLSASSGNPPHLLIPRDISIDGSSSSFARKLLNRIFSYGHQDLSWDSELQVAKESVGVAYTCKGLTGSTHLLLCEPSGSK